MQKVAAIAVSAATLAVLTVSGGQAMAGGQSSGTWPAAHPLPTHPGRVTSQTATTAVVRSTETVGIVKSKLDNLYVTQKGCTRRLAVNKPRDYLCYNIGSGRTDEIVFTFAALDPIAGDPSRSHTNAYFFKG